eukprot:9488502-Pyramimonas_sp.AAC.1
MGRGGGKGSQGRGGQSSWHSDYASLDKSWKGRRGRQQRQCWRVEWRSEQSRHHWGLRGVQVPLGVV